MKRTLLCLAGVLAFLGASEVIARYFISGSLDCLEPLPDRELLYELKPGAYESDGWLTRMPKVHIEINSDRCRRMPTHSEPGAAHPTILFLGDSMTFGLGVGDGETFPALVENIIRGRGAREITIENCGVPGYNLSQLVRAAELRLPQFKPRILALIVHSSDLESAVDFSSLTPRSATTRYAISHSRLFRYGYIMTSMLAMLRTMETSGKYLSADAINDYLRRLETAARESNSQIVVVKIAEIHHPSFSFDDALAAHGLPAYALRPLPRDERHFLADREHWTVTGQQIVADQVASIVEAALARAAADTAEKGASGSATPQNQGY